MALHFHMQNPTSTRPPAHPSCFKKRYCVLLARWRKAGELHVNRRPGCEEEERGKGKEGRRREGEADDEVAAVPWTHCAHYWPGSLAALWVINCSAAQQQPPKQSSNQWEIISPDRYSRVLEVASAAWMLNAGKISHLPSSALERSSVIRSCHLRNTPRLLHPTAVLFHLQGLRYIKKNDFFCSNKPTRLQDGFLERAFLICLPCKHI